MAEFSKEYEEIGQRISVMITELLAIQEEAQKLNFPEAFRIAQLLSRSASQLEGQAQLLNRIIHDRRFARER